MLCFWQELQHIYKLHMPSCESAISIRKTYTVFEFSSLSNFKQSMNQKKDENVLNHYENCVS